MSIYSSSVANDNTNSGTMIQWWPTAGGNTYQILDAATYDVITVGYIEDQGTGFYTDDAIARSFLSFDSESLWIAILAMRPSVEHMAVIKSVSLILRIADANWTKTTSVRIYGGVQPLYEGLTLDDDDSNGVPDAWEVDKEALRDSMGSTINIVNSPGKEITIPIPANAFAVNDYTRFILALSSEYKDKTHWIQFHSGSATNTNYRPRMRVVYQYVDKSGHDTTDILIDEIEMASMPDHKSVFQAGIGHRNDCRASIINMSDYGTISGGPYDACRESVQTSGFSDIAFGNFDSSLKDYARWYVEDTEKKWIANQWAGYTYIDASNIPFKIVGNTSTKLYLAPNMLFSGYNYKPNDGRLTSQYDAPPKKATDRGSYIISGSRYALNINPGFYYPLQAYNCRAFSYDESTRPSIETVSTDYRIINDEYGNAIMTDLVRIRDETQNWDVTDIRNWRYIDEDGNACYVVGNSYRYIHVMWPQGTKLPYKGMRFRVYDQYNVAPEHYWYRDPYIKRIFPKSGETVHELIDPEEKVAEGRTVVDGHAPIIVADYVAQFQRLFGSTAFDSYASVMQEETHEARAHTVHVEDEPVTLVGSTLTVSNTPIDNAMEVIVQATDSDGLVNILHMVNEGIVSVDTDGTITIDDEYITCVDFKVTYKYLLGYSIHTYFPGIEEDTLEVVQVKTGTVLTPQSVYEDEIIFSTSDIDEYDEIQVKYMSDPSFIVNWPYRLTANRTNCINVNTYTNTYIGATELYVEKLKNKDVRDLGAIPAIWGSECRFDSSSNMVRILPGVEPLENIDLNPLNSGISSGYLYVDWNHLPAIPKSVNVTFETPIYCATSSRATALQEVITAVVEVVDINDNPYALKNVSITPSNCYIGVQFNDGTLDGDRTNALAFYKTDINGRIRLGIQGDPTKTSLSLTITVGDYDHDNFEWISGEVFELDIYDAATNANMEQVQLIAMDPSDLSKAAVGNRPHVILRACSTNVYGVPKSRNITFTADADALAAHGDWLMNGKPTADNQANEPASSVVVTSSGSSDTYGLADIILLKPTSGKVTVYASTTVSGVVNVSNKISVGA